MTVPSTSATELARAVIAALLESGVTEVVVAPGSRNAPLSFAAYDAAQAGLLRLHTRIDERTAGFLALGLTRVGARAAVVCTSGTAVANLHPAVLEAAHAGLPLVVVSADRPLRLRGTNANQTTDQVGIFGPLVETTDVDRVDGLRLGASGPVHLNVRLDDPLVPDDRWALREVGRELRLGWGGAIRAARARWCSVRAPSSWPATTQDRPRDSSPKRPAGRCSPSRAAGHAPEATRCGATGCSWTPTSDAASNGWWCSVIRRCRAR